MRSLYSLKEFLIWFVPHRTACQYMVSSCLIIVCMDPAEVSSLYYFWYIAVGGGFFRTCATENGAQVCVELVTLMCIWKEKLQSTCNIGNWLKLLCAWKANILCLHPLCYFCLAWTCTVGMHSVWIPKRAVHLLPPTLAFQVNFTFVKLHIIHCGHVRLLMLLPLCSDILHLE